MVTTTQRIKEATRTSPSLRKSTDPKEPSHSMMVHPSTTTTTGPTRRTSPTKTRLTKKTNPTKTKPTRRTNRQPKKERKRTLTQLDTKNLNGSDTTTFTA
jgi:hypothetical protein